ncbi:hypothetical protein GF326_02810 [Candidatus Bathyarchaeota archaeon]|nr:hypothetical protein [Candidatus Bathyarchaeota archaeon]
MNDHGIKPELEIYDTGMINTAKLLSAQGVFKQPIHLQFVMVGRTDFSPTQKPLSTVLKKYNRSGLGVYAVSAEQSYSCVISP